MRLRVLVRDQYESLALRSWFAKRYEIEVGPYSYGCFDPQRISPYTRIGRYCSIAPSARIVNANHPMHAMSTHPYLYEARWGVIDRDRTDTTWLVIEDDVWIGHNATVLPGCKFIGRGAVIGAGSLVTKAVAPYTIVCGSPASPLRLRFAPEVIGFLEESRWWEFDKAELRRFVHDHPDIAFAPGSASLLEAT